jgi:sarcosine oxidase, subunit beta
VRADAVVLAAGVWSDDIARTAGIDLPMRTRAPQMLLSSPAPLRTLTPVIGATGRRLSLKQLRGGEFMLGGGWPGITSADRLSYTMLESSIRDGWAAAVAILPAVGEQHIVRKWCGLEAESFDKIPFIGPWPGVEGLIVATGFSGHGFAISPAVGRCIADQLAGRPAPELAGLDPSRVSTFDPAEVARYVHDTSDASLAVG